MWPCALKYAEEMKRSLDQHDPGWMQEEVWCQQHGVYHELTPAPGQRPLLGMDMGKSRESRPMIRFLSNGQPCFHESTSDVLTAPCAYCGTTLHAHKDMLGTVKSGRHGVGYLEESCPACHRANAVFPAYGNTAIRTTRLAQGKPVMQMKLG